MRAFAFFLVASLAAGPAAGAARRVASLNLCTDELVLMLAAPGQIASVTHLAQDPAETPLWRQGRRYQRNDGSLLSAAGVRPDLIVTMGGGARDRLRIAARLGIATLDLPFAQSLDEIVANVRQVAAALGRPAAGEAIVRRMAALVDDDAQRRLQRMGEIADLRPGPLEDLAVRIDQEIELLS